MAMAAALSACGGPVRIAARTASDGSAEMVDDATIVAAASARSEQLPAHIALLIPSSEIAMTFQHFGAGNDSAAYELMVGEALRDLAAAHLDEVVDIVDTVNEARAPLDRERSSFLLELNTRAFDASVDGVTVDWEIGVRLADELNFRAFHTYSATGNAAGRAPGAMRGRNARLEFAMNDAMSQIVGQLWGDLKEEMARRP
jgi:hypothetical protein